MLYTTEFDPLSLHPSGQRTDVYQYDLRKGTAAAIAQSRLSIANLPFVPNQSLRFWGLQLAPDSTVWVADLNGFHLDFSSGPYLDGPFPKATAIIRHPNVAGAGCQFDLNGFVYPGRVLTTTFPNVINNMLYPPTAVLAEATCGEDSVRFWTNSAQTGPPGRWDFGDSGSGAANAATGYAVAHRYARGGTYRVRVVYADGRALTRQFTVSGTDADFTNANVFTPNGDGQNDLFRPVSAGAALPDARLRVFSRWGQAVFEARGPQPAWDGAGAAAGEYFYQLDYPDCAGVPQHRRGTVALVR